MDIENFIDYQIASIFFSCYDFPGNNVKLWRSKKGRWRWLILDSDYCFTDYQYNSFAHCLNEEGVDWPNPAWSTLLFRKLMENNSFKLQFIQQFELRLNTTFCTEKILKQLDYFQDRYEIEINEHINRWGKPNDKESWLSHIDNFRTFALHRPAIIRALINDSFETNIQSPCLGKPLKLFDIFPNPTQEHITIRYTGSEEVQFECYNTLGKKVFETNLFNRPFNIEHLAPGLYFIIGTNNHQSFTKKWVKY